MLSDEDVDRIAEAVYWRLYPYLAVLLFIAAFLLGRSCGTSSVHAQVSLPPATPGVIWFHPMSDPTGKVWGIFTAQVQVPAPTGLATPTPMGTPRP